MPPPPAQGFTLIEMLITVTIVAILASVAMPLSQLAVQRAKETELRRALRDIRDAIDVYKSASDEGRIARAADASGYPPSLSVLVEGVADARRADSARIYFLRSLPRDPFGDDPSSPASANWGIRSYESPHDDPRPGKDVFDVYPLSAGVGLNGIPYRDW